ncbi:MAG TPA: NAD(P)H-dependent glycerol-3-phosphate dehydrogenase [Clostridiaceae bacterium]|nr:NAD(P)H-dependent glycerol-3-phosphate dehydrogenase [Clostridiaceae bacterium]
MRVSVIGCGRWGTFLAWYSARIGHDVMLYGRQDSVSYNKLLKDRKNEYLELPDSVKLTCSISCVIEHADFIIIAIGAQQLRSLAREIALLNPAQKVFILCMKGIEANTGKRLSQVLSEELGPSTRIALWVGPGHVQQFLNNIPSCMVIGSQNIELTKKIVDEFGSELIRFYYGQDIIGNEVGAAAKNVIGIAGGMLDGLGVSGLKGALMARGAREVSRLIRAMGGNELTAYGLCHLGDYEATLFSQYSHNRMFGKTFVKGEKFDKLAEGVSTAEALVMLSKLYEVDMPICSAVYSIVKEGNDPKEVLTELFMRRTKFEF